MANTFKVDTKSSLTTDAFTSANTPVLTAGGTATLIVLSILVSNKTGTSADVDLYLVTNTGDDVYILKNVPVPAGSTLDALDNSKLVMESSDVLHARCGTASALDISVSYLEQTP